MNEWKPPFHHCEWPMQSIGDLLFWDRHFIVYLPPFQLRSMGKAGAQNFWKSDYSRPISCIYSNQCQCSHEFQCKKHIPLDLKQKVLPQRHCLRTMDLCWVISVGDMALGTLKQKYGFLIFFPFRWLFTTDQALSA